MAPTLRIALVQFQAKPLCVSENFERAASEIRSAAAQGNHIVVLPEYHLTSWAPEDPTFTDACAASATYFISGTTGEILGTYRKKNLWHVERGILTADKKSPHKAFDVPFPGSSHVVRVGLLICWDLAFPEALRQLVADGAKLVIIPAYWHINKVNPKLLALSPDSEAVFLDSATVARAYENTCAVAFCNAWGHSQVTMPVLGSLGKLGAEKEGCIISEVDLDTLEVAESHYKVREDIGSKEWHY